jgi:hypothetical protein
MLINGEPSNRAADDKMGDGPWASVLHLMKAAFRNIDALTAKVDTQAREMNALRAQHGADIAVLKQRHADHDADLKAMRAKLAQAAGSQRGLLLP